VLEVSPQKYEAVLPADYDSAGGILGFVIMRHYHESKHELTGSIQNLVKVCVFMLYVGP